MRTALEPAEPNGEADNHDVPHRQRRGGWQCEGMIPAWYISNAKGKKEEEEDPI